LVPLIENNDHESPGASYFIEKYTRGLLNLSAEIDTVLLGCTHYPVIETQIKQWAGEHVRIISQGEIISESLADYLGRHPEIHERIAQHGDRRFYTSDDPVDFENHAPLFFGQPVKAEQVKI
jgi:glutamate racemase